MNFCKLFALALVTFSLAAAPNIAQAQRQGGAHATIQHSAPAPSSGARSAGPAGHNWNGGRNGNWNGRNGDWRDHNGNWHHGYWRRGWDTTVVIGGFGSPFYPYGYGYYPYDAYGYGYGYGGYYTPYYGGPAPVVYQGEVAGARGDGSIVIQVQRRLARAGLYHGSIDGVMGSGTRRAIRAYERQHRLPVDGEIDNELLATMGLA
jgi:hypothetical protein